MGIYSNSPALEAGRHLQTKYQVMKRFKRSQRVDLEALDGITGVGDFSKLPYTSRLRNLYRR